VGGVDSTGLLPGWIVDASWLTANLGPPLVVLDATVLMTTPEHDGDYRVESGYRRFLKGHVPGARHADLVSDLSDTAAVYHFARPAPQRLARALERLGVEDGSPVLVYDSEHGLWAARLWWMLRWIGVPAGVLDGGWGQWLAHGGAVESGDRCDPGPGASALARGGETLLSPREQPGMWVGRDDVVHIVEGSRPGTLVCALSAESFAGAVPTRYARRGHIPTSVNVPFRDLVGPDERMLEPEALSMALGNLQTQPRPIVAYCGGGISASVVALALTVLGRDDVAIYDGSLEEWSADGTLPVETGPLPAG